MDQSYVRFQRGLLENYKALETKQKDTLYFVHNEESNSTALYLGERLIAGTGEIIGSDSLSGLNDVLIKSVADKNILMYDSEANNWVNISFDKLLEEIQTQGNYLTEDSFTSFSETINNNYNTLSESLQSEIETARNAEATLNTRIDNLNYISNEMLAEELSSYATLQKLTEDYLGTTAINELLRLKADISTTLAGYGITDAYTKAETDQAIADKVASITGGESAAAVKMALEAEITRSTTKDTEHDNILSALNERIEAIEEGSWENVIDAVDENDFDLENKILSLKSISSSKIVGLENHSVITTLQNAVSQNTENIGSLNTSFGEILAQLNNCVQNSEYDAKMQSIDSDIALLKEAMTWKNLE